MKNGKVTASCGKIKGIVTNDAIIYKGVPYAITERFEFPKELPLWKDEFDASSSGTDCYQQSSFPNLNFKSIEFFDKEFPPQKEFVYADSPMCLNIISPLQAENCPVVIFFHGGGHIIGKFDELPYGDSCEYAKRGIILVNVGYRLNVFSAYNGQNYGLHDMLFSIDWVKKHIASFGGNPDNITLMGQSAGAMSIMCLLYNQKLKGKIKGAILLSGGGVIPKAFGPYTSSETKKFWSSVMKSADADNIDDLKKADPQIVWYAWNTELQKNKKSYRLIQPSIDGEIIPDYPQNIIRKNLDLDIPLIISVTSQDLMAPVMYKVARDYARRNARKNRSPVYCCMFDRTLPGKSYKAFHSGDLWYAFGNMDKSWRDFNEIDKNLSRMIIDYYSNFIKTQNPNNDTLPDWKAVSKFKTPFRHFDGLSKGYIPHSKCLLKVYKTMLFDRGPL
ncbi:MAG: carboxylesterase family protein [Treponemataceae bacterium]|nr:carboxylesterase family protein [Treponemataceae bacterium]